MCRFLAYSGRPVLLCDLIYKPANSLIKQSIKAKESHYPHNGDGFGIAWYNQELDNEPGIFTSCRPAWNDLNLYSLSKKIKSDRIFAHVRAANSGGVSEFNSHPFAFNNFLFMHNGEIEDFQLIQRFLRRELSDDIYSWIRGQTDSEHLFALFMHYCYRDFSKNPNPEEMMLAMTKTISRIEELKLEHGAPKKSENYINLCVSDGSSTICLRYVSHQANPASSLYYTKGTKYECLDGVCHIRNAEQSKVDFVLVASEKLTDVDKDWQEVPVNHFVVIDNDQKISLYDYSEIQNSQPVKGYSKAG